MPRIEEGTISAPLPLHDALTHYECKVCGESLQWNLGFNNNLNQPTYTATHCNLEYEIIIDTVKIRILKPSEQLKEQEIVPINEMVVGNKKLQKHQEKKKSEIQMQAEREPRAITMARALEEEGTSGTG